MQHIHCECFQTKKLDYIHCKHVGLLLCNVYHMSKRAITSITDSSFSAVGLFFGFFVRDTLTKLWKAVDLGNKMSLFQCNDHHFYLLIPKSKVSQCHPIVAHGIFWGAHHLFLSFSFGGWKLLFDIKNKALGKNKKHGLRVVQTDLEREIYLVKVTQVSLPPLLIIS